MLSIAEQSSSSGVSPLVATADVDALLAQEMSRLSFLDRNKIQEEIHGVHSMASEETFQTVSDALFRLDQCIEELPVNEKQAYLNAQRMYKDAFVLKESTRLCFLRAELFNPKTAASRYTKYLHLLLKYFGPTALDRPLRYSDLSKQEQDLCRAGNAQILPSRDRAGRLVVVHNGSIGGKDVCGSTRLRIFLYVYCVVAEDLQTQRHGVVAIFVADREHFDRFNGGSQDYQADLSDLMKNLPVRWSAMHVYLPEGPLYTLLKALLVIVMLRKDERVRLKFYAAGLHDLEAQYNLMSFGIPIQELPVTHTGIIKKKNHAQWIKVRKLVDQEREKGTTGNLSFVEHPAVHDVLFRRGGNNCQFGNVLFQEAILTELHTYNSLHNHSEKRRIRDRIIHRVTTSHGGRFLEYKKDLGVWCEITDATHMHNKIISSMNDLTRMLAAREHLQESNCETEKFLSKRRRIDTTSCCHLGS